MVIILVNEEELRSEFNTFGIHLKDSDVIDKLREICQFYKLNAEAIVETWMAFATSKQLDSEPTVQLLTQLQNEELMSNKKKITKSTAISTTKQHGRVYNASTIEELMDVDHLMQLYGSPELQAGKKRFRSPENTVCKKLNGEIICKQEERPASPSTLKITPSTKYTSRENSRDIVCEFGTTTKALWITKNSEPVSVVLYSEDDGYQAGIDGYRYMFERMRSALEFLNGRIVHMEDLYKAEYKIEELAHLRLPSADVVNVVGRICCDSNGKLNSSSILLEGSLRSSAGLTVEMDVSQLKSYSFFPGQIVALSAINNRGNRLLAKDLYTPIIPRLPTEIPYFVTKAKSLSLVVASGPYMTSDNLSYKPLEDLLEIVRVDTVDACILVGPFVDARHKEIMEGNLDETYNEKFDSCMSLIESLAKSLRTQFIIVPSANDVHHHFIYPTPPFTKSKDIEKMQNIHFVSDPSLLSIDGLIVGITATDVLFQLGKEEISYPAGMSDRLGRLASHILTQQSFYPLYPSPEELHLNFDKMDSSTFLPVTPHLLILPSDLNYFVKDISGCCCINPQRLTKGTAGGTYGVISVSKDGKPEDPLINRIACKVVKV